MKTSTRKIQLFKLFGYLHQHPGVLISGFYFLLTFAGVVFTNSYYNTFDIPFLHLADLSDFMVAGIAEPMALVLVIGAMLIAVFVDFLFNLTHRKREEWRAKPASPLQKFMLWTYYTPRTALGAYALIFVMFLLPYTYLFVSLYAGWKGRQVSVGNGTYVELQMGGESTSVERIMLGSTVNYLLVYDAVQHRAEILPIENVERLQPLPRSQVQ